MSGKVLNGLALQFKRAAMSVIAFALNFDSDCFPICAFTSGYRWREMGPSLKAIAVINITQASFCILWPL